MTSRRIRRAVAVTALAAAPTLLLAPNAFATGLPAHHRQPSHQPSPHRHHHALTKKEAVGILKFDAHSVAGLAKVEQKSKCISSADQASLKTATTAEKAALASDLAAAKAGSSASAYKKAVKAGGLTTAEAGLDYGTAVAANGIELRDAALNKIATKLEAKASTGSGKKAAKAKAKTALVKVAGLTAKADKDAKAAVAAVLALPAAPSAHQLGAAERTAFKDEAKARQAEGKASWDISKAVFDLAPPHHRHHGGSRRR